MRNNKWQASSKERLLKKDKANQILLFWNQKLNQPICIRDIKAGVWNSKSKDPPCNATISKNLKRELGMSYRTLSTLHPKTQSKDHTRAYCEGVIIKFILADMEREEVFIGEFNISSHWK